MRIIHVDDTSIGLQTVLDQVIDDVEVAIIYGPDTPGGVLMSLDHYNSLMETVHLLSSPANAAHLAKSLGQASNGRIQARTLSDISDS